jgi:hypothetical protein
MAFKVVDQLEISESEKLQMPPQGMVALGVVGGRLVGSNFASMRIRTSDPITVTTLTATNDIFTIDLSGTDRIFEIVPLEDSTISVSGATLEEFNEFIIQVTDGGAYVLTYPSGTRFVSGTPPELSNPGTDMLAFNSLDGGTTWNCISIALGLLVPPS